MKRNIVKLNKLRNRFLLGTLLCVVLSICLLPMQATAAEEGQVDNDCITLSSATVFQLATKETEETWDGTMEYSFDKINWITWDGGYITSAAGEDGKHYIYVRGDNNTVVSGGTTWALMKPYVDTTIDISGNIETLRGATGDKPASLQMAANCYGGMFRGDEWLSSAPELPATSLAENCYKQMFEDCISLRQAPELPADTLAEGCYQYMFMGCNGLTTAPELQATELAEYCYAHMFDSCCYLKYSPTELPADTLAPNCYMEMFSECIRLETVPKLPATELAESCYEGMFANCSVLKKSPELPATVLAENCYFGMFTRCSELQSVPKLPAKKLAKGCYAEMFLGCQSLAAPANMSNVTELAENCCYRMYENCINLGIYKESKPGRTKKWKVSIAGDAPEGWSDDMFSNTYGDFTGSPVEGTTYYIANRTPKVHTAITADVDGGYVRIHQQYFVTGKTVEAEAVPYDGYVATSLVARDANGRDIPVVDNKFTMPDSDVTLIAVFKLDISNCTVSGLSEKYTYTGKVIEPTVTVTVGDTTLTQGKDYTVSYENNTEVGTAELIITGTGDYAGTVSRTFAIVKVGNDSAGKADTGDSGNAALLGLLCIIALCGAGFVHKKREN